MKRLLVVLIVGLVLVWGCTQTETIKTGVGKSETVETKIAETEERIDELIKQLGDDDWRTREEATESLEKIGKPVVPALEEALKNKDAEIRYRTRGILTKIRWNIFIDEIESITIVKRHIKYYHVPIDKKFFAKIHKMIREGALSHIPRAPCETCGKMLITKLKSEKVIKTEWCACGSGEFQSLIKKLTSGFEAKLINRNIDDIISHLSDANWGIKLCALDSLWQMKEIKKEKREKVVGQLIRLLKAPENKVRFQAVIQLGRLGGERAIDPLIEKLGDKDKEVRSYAASWLGKLKTRKAVKPLLRDLSDKDWQVRAAVCEALGNIGDTRAIELLIKALKDKSEYVRYHAALALGLMKAKASVTSLIGRLENDKHKNVRLWAADALKKITGRDFGYDAVNPSSEESKKAIELYRKWWEENKDE